MTPEHGLRYFGYKMFALFFLQPWAIHAYKSPAGWISLGCIYDILNICSQDTIKEFFSLGEF